MKQRAMVKLEVFENAAGTITVCTDNCDGGGVRLCGIKLAGSGSSKIAAFHLSRDAINELVEAITAEEARLSADPKPAEETP